MIMKALFTYDYGKDNMDKIKDLGYDVLYANEKDITYREDMSEIEVLVCYNPFKTLDIEKMRSLSWIQLSSIGIDQLPDEYVKDTNIIVTNNRGGYSIPMGEWVVMNMLEIMKNTKQFFKNQQSRKWKVDTSILELYGKRVGFVGTGSIATESAKRLRGFGVEVVGLNTKGRPAEYFDRCFGMADIDKMLALCDVVVVTIPYTNETHHLINEERFKAMKDGVCFINVARGAIVDTGALINNLRNGKLRGAAIDVFEEEPLSENNPLWEFENVILTPHNSWISEMRNERRFDLIYENMKRFINKQELKNVVDLNRGY
jgi:phosphoglycerate dehydrogenase-like enzyme